MSSLIQRFSKILNCSHRTILKCLLNLFLFLWFLWSSSLLLLSLIIFFPSPHTCHLFSKHIHMHITQAHIATHTHTLPCTQLQPGSFPCCENTFCCALSCTPALMVLFMENDDFDMEVSLWNLHSGYTNIHLTSIFFIYPLFTKYSRDTKVWLLSSRSI